jgi:hypothetical protein
MHAYRRGRTARRRAGAARTVLVAGAAALGLIAFDRGVAHAVATIADVAREAGEARDPVRRYGAPTALGQGRARTYVVEQDGAPIEIGVALDERALDGLPAPGTGHMGAHGEMHEFVLPLPQAHGTPFTFVELDWNPGGHEPPGVYDTPHFDFHFYTIDRAARDAIDPASNPRYADEANRLPAPELTPKHYALPLPPGAQPVSQAVPRMGVHLVDMRSPELQGLLGNPQGHRPFTTTFIHGAWDGRVIFFEPMITRAHILSKKAERDAAYRDEIIPIPAPQRYERPGHYPSAYRIAWDARAKEFRIALTQLAPQR